MFKGLASLVRGRVWIPRVYAMTVSGCLIVVLALRIRGRESLEQAGQRLDFWSDKDILHQRKKVLAP